MASPRTDTTRLVSELAAQMIRDVLDVVKLSVFAGPSAGILSKRDALAKLSTPEQRIAAAQTVDVDKLIADAIELGA